MKYIIDLPENTVWVDATKSNIKNGYITFTSNIMPITELTPYTEIDKKEIEDNVWEFATICTKMNGADSVDVFGGFSLDSFANLSYQEAKTKYNEWLRKNHDGCNGCKYDYKSSGEEPCFSCKQNYLDKWEATE